MHDFLETSAVIDSRLDVISNYIIDSINHNLECITHMRKHPLWSELE